MDLQDDTGLINTCVDLAVDRSSCTWVFSVIAPIRNFSEKVSFLCIMKKSFLLLSFHWDIILVVWIRKDHIFSISWMSLTVSEFLIALLGLSET
ncbi:unnamed protein product [Moneuplotes crassus]|uniref:Uncharacterized protein n=1 Tax=Euplotes crassus TaxID=5936 RepID=A0AAD1XRC3_EUPCR|nr:unnamed protein product [Moneuplotes crassus]